MIIVIAVAKGIKQTYGAGNFKDFIAFNALLTDKSINFRLVELELDSHRQNNNIVNILDRKPSHLICHYSYWPTLFQQLKSKSPNLKIFTRTHNAEAFQHWQRSGVNWNPTYDNLRNIYGSARLFLQDIKCRQYSDHLLGISEWDNQNYWRYMPGKGKITYTPYHCPWPKLRPQVSPRPWENRQNLIVSLPGGRDRFGLSQIQNLQKFARYISQVTTYSDWSFYISSGVRKNDDDMEAIKPLELLDSMEEPWDLLCSVKALALLTPFGFGSKTTIIDALTAGCHVLVDKTLAQRLDPDVKPLCQIIDLTNPKTMIDAMAKIQLPPPQNNINSILKTKAINSLKNLFS